MIDPHALFPVGTSVKMVGHLSGRVVGHRMTKIIINTDQRLPVVMPMGTRVLDDFTVVVDPALLSKVYE